MYNVYKKDAQLRLSGAAEVLTLMHRPRISSESKKSSKQLPFVIKIRSILVLLVLWIYIVKCFTQLYITGNNFRKKNNMLLTRTCLYVYKDKVRFTRVSVPRTILFSLKLFYSRCWWFSCSNLRYVVASPRYNMLSV